MEFGHGTDFPPTEGWPSAVRKLADEVGALQDRKILADRALADLLGDQSPGTRDAIAHRLEQEDAAALAEAARAGIDTATIGRPAVEQYERDVNDARREVDAVGAALAAASAELCAAIQNHADQLLDVADALAEQGRKVYADAVAALPTARAKLYEGAALRSFVERAAKQPASADTRLIYVNRVPAELAADVGFNVPTFATLVAQLASEADAVVEP
jgi:hypothetical protein